MEQHPIEESTAGFAIIINGHSLVHCLHPQMERLFLEVVLQCKSVICCRVTPLQKALVVELIKKNRNAVTLAVGDGANDVSMIKGEYQLTQLRNAFSRCLFKKFRIFSCTYRGGHFRPRRNASGSCL